jgi:zinc transport system substrate-binding protein
MSFLRIFCLFLLLGNEAWSLDVVASINPVKQIILAIKQDVAGEVHLIIRSSQSEHNFQFKNRDISAINDADLVFFIDDSLEKNFSKLIKNHSFEQKSFELSQANGIKLLQSRANHQKIDPHLWLDPQNSIAIAGFISEKFCEKDAQNCAKYQNNYKQFSRKINQLEKAIKSDLASLGSDYVIYHDAYQYFENSFGLKAHKIISYDHHSNLKMGDIKGLDSAKCLIGEKVDERNSAEKLAKNHHLKFIKVDVLGGEESFENLLKNIAASFAECR